MKLGERTPLRKGEKRPARAPKPQSTLGGKFTSMGNSQSQGDVAALMVKMCSEIGTDGYLTLTKYDKIFIDDVRIKIRTTHGQAPMFGYRQLEKMVAVHKAVMEARGGANGGT